MQHITAIESWHPLPSTLVPTGAPMDPQLVHYMRFVGPLLLLGSVLMLVLDSRSGWTKVRGRRVTRYRSPIVFRMRMFKYVLLALVGAAMSAFAYLIDVE